FFLSYSFHSHRALHSFPTRRSSDLARRHIFIRVFDLGTSRPRSASEEGFSHQLENGLAILRDYFQPGHFSHHREIDAAETEAGQDRKSTRLNSSHEQDQYAVLCLKK